MARRTKRRFSLWVAAAVALTVLGIPVGVYTYAVLTRESVEELYRSAAGAGPPKPVLEVTAAPDGADCDALPP